MRGVINITVAQPKWGLLWMHIISSLMVAGPYYRVHIIRNVTVAEVRVLLQDAHY